MMSSKQEIVDVTNEIARNGLIFFPEFCEVVLARFRAEDEEAFRQNMFKVNKNISKNILKGFNGNNIFTRIKESTNTTIDHSIISSISLMDSMDLSSP